MKGRTTYRETTVEWMRLRIKSMIWNIKKQNTTNQSNKKEKYPKEDSIMSLWDNLKRSNIHITGCQKEKRKSKKLEIYLKDSGTRLL